MSQKDLDKIIRDYLSGKPSQEGERLFNAWFDAAPEDKVSPLEGLSSAEKEKLRKEIFAKATAAKSVQLSPLQEKTQYVQGSRPWYRMAAVWVGILLLGFATLLYLNSQNNTTTVQTAFGEVKTISLPDGSEVTLNANSSLSYATDWEENPVRQVWLDGEAYFSVVHTQDDRKFEVHASQMNVEVLGTEFNVNNRRGDTEVVLHSGKVKLAVNKEDTSEEIFMEPGELVTFSENTQSLSKQIVNPENYSTWRNQELLLDNTSLAEIARALEDYYGFEVVIPDNELKDISLTATAKLSLKDTEVILSAISEIYGIEVEQKGKQIIFSNP
ncbi:FecR domain-containing protein [Catalinimonas sp. 4WD22]|uniref:FecR family protein n=1 Tax=Catalinimonas locisalis TaxID=3133978 RepID=UPI003100D0B0